jgi:chemotaxis protein methyltransferase CheR
VVTGQEELCALKDPEVVKIELELLIQAVLAKFQYDFRSYSRSSLRRRLEQALIRFKLESISQIQHHVLHEPDFFPQLIPYLTVNTTEMFRDPGYYRALKEKVFPYLKTFPSIKIWVAGCSTGEEVYSLAIFLKEAGIKKFRIYATDINPMNLKVAKKGIYERESIQRASRSYQEAGGEASLSDYYEAAYDSVQMRPELLQSVVFSDHSLATDSVFSEMHLISCRNVLIYFDRDLQDRVFRLFRDSLIRDGFLGLGTKETLQFSSVFNEFEVLNREFKLYQKKKYVGP